MQRLEFKANINFSKAFGSPCNGLEVRLIYKKCSWLCCRCYMFFCARWFSSPTTDSQRCTLLWKQPAVRTRTFLLLHYRGCPNVWKCMKSIVSYPYLSQKLYNHYRYCYNITGVFIAISLMYVFFCFPQQKWFSI